ncbi:MAG TPA: hypothetical protein DHV01_09255 [Rhodoferax sp.]|nr:hypothetical protein [Rhodoferax sp.]
MAAALAFLAGALAGALAAGFAAGLAAGFAAALALGAAGAAAGAAFSAVRWSRKALISAEILFLRSVSLAMLSVSLAIALASLDTTAFLAFAGAAIFLGETAALGAAFFAVAMGLIFLLLSDQ